MSDCKPVFECDECGASNEAYAVANACHDAAKRAYQCSICLAIHDSVLDARSCCSQLVGETPAAAPAPFRAKDHGVVDKDLVKRPIVDLLDRVDPVKQTPKPPTKPKRAVGGRKPTILDPEIVKRAFAKFGSFNLATQELKTTRLTVKTQMTSRPEIKNAVERGLAEYNVNRKQQKSKFQPKPRLELKGKLSPDDLRSMLAGGMTVVGIAEKSGVNTSTIHSWIKNKKLEYGKAYKDGRAAFEEKERESAAEVSKTARIGWQASSTSDDSAPEAIVVASEDASSVEGQESPDRNFRSIGYHIENPSMWAYIDDTPANEYPALFVPRPIGVDLAREVIHLTNIGSLELKTNFNVFCMTAAQRQLYSEFLELWERFKKQILPDSSGKDNGNSDNPDELSQQVSRT